MQSLTIRQVSSQNASPLWCWQPPSGMGSHNSTAGIRGTSVPDPCVNFQSSQGRVSILGMPMVSIWVTSGISHRRGPFFAKSFPALVCGLLWGWGGGTQRSTKQKWLESGRRGRGHQNINRPGKGRLHFGFSLMWLTASYEKLEVKSKCLYASFQAPRLFSYPWGIGEKTASCVSGDATLCTTYMCWTE